MKRLFLILMIFSITLPINAIEVSEEWYYGTIETLKKSREQIELLQGMVDELTDENIGLMIEVKALEDKIDILHGIQKNSTRGLWIGAGSGYPFGVYGSVGYQFNSRFLIESYMGYMGQWQIQAGMKMRIRE